VAKYKAASYAPGKFIPIHFAKQILPGTQHAVAYVGVSLHMPLAILRQVSSQIRCSHKGIGMFQKGSGDWQNYRHLPSLVEVDFHYSDFGPRTIPYDEAMYNVWVDALEALKGAYQKGEKYVMFRHGASTSGPFRRTARSQVRNLMRSKVAPPYIIRKECIQHKTVFVAAIKPNPNIQSPE